MNEVGNRIEGEGNLKFHISPLVWWMFGIPLSLLLWGAVVLLWAEIGKGIGMGV